MFQSVVESRGLWTGRFSAGTAVSVLLHAGALAAAVFFTTRQAPPPRPEPVLEFVHRVPPQPPRGSPTPPATPEAAPKPKPKPRPRQELVQPSRIPPPPPETAAPPEAAPPAEALPYVEGGHPGGVETGGVAGAMPLPFLNSQAGEQPSGEEVLPFGASMTPPQLLSGAPLAYTREALEARVHGLLIARCTITREGAVTGCHVIKGLPFMNEAALTALESRRYRPVHYQGKPVSVSYTFHVKLDMPR
jgi:periplasmic protein TonB